MKSESRQDKRRLKLNKLKKDKKNKNKKKINKRLKEKPVILESAHTFSVFLFVKKMALTTGMMGLLAYLFLLSPSQSVNQKNYGHSQFATMSQTTPIAEAADFSSDNLSDLSLIATNNKPEIKGETYNQIISIIKGTPMEKMAYAISNRDRAVAAYLVGIGMKESKFGIYSPKKNGKECYNYWGYRGKENTTASGYSCFDSPEHAVKVVGDRIESFIDQGRETPEQMIVWKCGYSCNGHSKESVNKWIKDVSIHYYNIAQIKQVAVITQ